jgi:hypothetical protein
MAADEIRVPREHDRVMLQGKNGVLTVVDVDTTAKTVALQFVTGDGPLVRDVAWTDLAYMGEESGEPASPPADEDVDR